MTSLHYFDCLLFINSCYLYLLLPKVIIPDCFIIYYFISLIGFDLFILLLKKFIGCYCA